MTWLMDTNVLSELVKPNLNSGVEQWARDQTFVSISAITLEEIFYGLARKPHPRIQTWFEGYFSSGACEVLPVDAAVARACGVLRGRLQKLGKTRTQADMMIAATAAVHGLTVVTRNVADFDGCGVALLNPFQ